MPEYQQRRQAPRIVIPGRLEARAHATLPVRLLDLSTAGARIEHQSPDPARPGPRRGRRRQRLQGHRPLPERLADRHGSVRSDKGRPP